MITFDPAKRERTLQERGIDFMDAAFVFAGKTVTFDDDRFDYGERRQIIAGRLRGRMVLIVWTARRKARHVISMRFCHAKEERKIQSAYGDI